MRSGLTETDLVPAHPGLAASLSSGAPGPERGGWDVVEPQGSRIGLMTGPVLLVHLRDVLWSPASNLVAFADGRLPDAPAQQVPKVDQALAALLAARPRRVARGAIWLSGGSTGNYGHFLMDSLTGLAALEDLGLTQAFPPHAGPLAVWQQGLVQAAQIASPLQTARDRAVRFDELIYVTTLGHYLQRNGALLSALLARIQPQRPPLRADGAVIYLSRRAFSGRIMVNEARLEAALAARGVRILYPERMAPADQIAAAAGARMLIGASGAALANICFLPQGARLIELRPQTVVEQWLDLAADLRGLDHRVIPGRAPLPRAEVPIGTKLRQLPRLLARRYHYAWSVDIAEVLEAMD